MRFVVPRHDETLSHLVKMSLLESSVLLKTLNNPIKLKRERVDDNVINLSKIHPPVRTL